MENGNLFRNLKKDEIEARIGTMSKSGFSVLLYKTARTDARLFDETFGPLNWQCQYHVVNDNLFCAISVYDKENNQWVTKENVGTESNTEKEKGEASDALKRAGFTWGCGVELYTAPFIWFSTQGFSLPEKPRIDFDLQEYECSNDKVITHLKIVAKVKDSDGKYHDIPYLFGKAEKPKETDLICEDCGKPITAHGSVPATTIVIGSRKAYGRALCWDCSKKVKANV